MALLHRHPVAQAREQTNSNARVCQFALHSFQKPAVSLYFADKFLVSLYRLLCTQSNI